MACMVHVIVASTLWRWLMIHLVGMYAGMPLAVAVPDTVSERFRYGTKVWQLQAMEVEGQGRARAGSKHEACCCGLGGQPIRNGLQQ